MTAPAVLQLHDESWDSGLAHYALTLSAELVKRGRRVLFWAKKDSYAAAKARSLGLETRELERAWFRLASLRKELSRAGVGVVDAHTGSAQSLGAALTAGSRAALVRTCADARPPKGHALSRALAKRTRAYVAANSVLAAHLSKAFPKTRVELIAQGVAAPAEPPPPLPPVPAAGLLGRLDPVKGHADLIEAAALLRARDVDVRLRFAGEGRLKRELAGTAAARIPGGAEFLGRVESAAAFIATCTIGCVPSTGSEAVSRAALEWMASGRPVVATRVGGLPDLIVHGETGLLVSPANPAELAEALETLTRDQALAARMGQAARERWARKFSPAVFAHATERLYDSL